MCFTRSIFEEWFFISLMILRFMVSEPPLPPNDKIKKSLFLIPSFFRAASFDSFISDLLIGFPTIFIFSFFLKYDSLPGKLSNTRLHFPASSLVDNPGQTFDSCIIVGRRLMR